MLNTLATNWINSVSNQQNGKHMEINQLNEISHFPQNFTLAHLPVLDKMLVKATDIVGNKALNKTAVFYVHHPLQTSVNVISAMLSLGVQPNNMFVLGKRYSECDVVVEHIKSMGVNYQPCSMQSGLGRYAQSFTRDINWMWAKLIETISQDVEEILVLDHGGHALAYLPPQLLEHYKVIGIEKTTAGLMDLDTHGLPPFPLIGVANCAAKRYLESPMIAEAVVNKLMTLIPFDKGQLTCGVAGYGAIGKAITKQLLALGHHVIIYDKNCQQLDNSTTAIQTSDLSALISYADYIFGCSGRDITESMLEQFRLTTRDKTLISCSSEDKEFLSLVKKIGLQDNIDSAPFDPLDHLEYKSAFGATVHVLRGGFPVNFDNSGESVPAKDIQLTRSLVLAAIFQAIDYFKKPDVVNNKGLYALDSSIQQFVVEEWLNDRENLPYSKSLIESFNDKDWILKNSNGLHEPCSAIDFSQKGIVS